MQSCLVAPAARRARAVRHALRLRARLPRQRRELRRASRAAPAAPAPWREARPQTATERPRRRRGSAPAESAACGGVRSAQVAARICDKLQTQRRWARTVAASWPLPGLRAVNGRAARRALRVSAPGAGIGASLGAPPQHNATQCSPQRRDDASASRARDAADAATRCAPGIAPAVGIAAAKRRRAGSHAADRPHTGVKARLRATACGGRALAARRGSRAASRAAERRESPAPSRADGGPEQAGTFRVWYRCALMRAVFASRDYTRYASTACRCSGAAGVAAGCAAIRGFVVGTDGISSSAAGSDGCSATAAACGTPVR